MYNVVNADDEKTLILCACLRMVSLEKQAKLYYSTGSDVL